MPARVVLVAVPGSWDRRSEGEASKPLIVREGRARERVCRMYCDDVSDVATRLRFLGWV